METESSIGKLIGVEAVAEAFGLRRQQVYALAKENRLPCVRIGRLVKFNPVVLRAFVEAGGCALPGGWRREAQ